MKKPVIVFLALLSGVAIGAASTRQFYKKKYEAISQEDINSVREAFGNRANIIAHYDMASIVKEKPDLAEYSAIVNNRSANSGHVDYNKISTPQVSEPLKASTSNDELSVNVNDPFIITDEEFSERDDFDTGSLTYYADGILTNEDDCVVNAYDVIGDISLTSFGDDEWMYVRNPILKKDFEINKSEVNFNDDLYADTINLQLEE